MDCCLVAKFPDQKEVADVVCYKEVVIRLVLKKVNANFFPMDY